MRHSVHRPSPLGAYSFGLGASASGADRVYGERTRAIEVRL